MYTSASDRFLTPFTKSQCLTLSERSFCRGYAKSNTKERNVKSTDEVVYHAYHLGDILIISR